MRDLVRIPEPGNGPGVSIVLCPVPKALRDPPNLATVCARRDPVAVRETKKVPGCVGLGLIFVFPDSC